MASVNDDLLGSQQSDTTSETHSRNDEAKKNDGFDEYFQKLNYKLPMREKIELICTLHQHNYFIDAEITS